MGRVGGAAIDPFREACESGVAQKGWVVLAGADCLPGVGVRHDGSAILTTAPG